MKYQTQGFDFEFLTKSMHLQYLNSVINISPSSCSERQKLQKKKKKNLPVF